MRDSSLYVQESTETENAAERRRYEWILEKIEGLVKIIENSSLTEFTLKEGDMKITMSKLDHPPVVAAGDAGMAAPATTGGGCGKENPEDEALYHFSQCGNLFIQLRLRML